MHWLDSDPKHSHSLAYSTKEGIHMNNLLEITGLDVSLRSRTGLKKAIDGLDLSIGKQEVVGVVGESGCGKSLTALSVMGLIPSSAGKVTAGDIVFRGESLRAKSPAELRKMRGKDMAMIFQEPMTSLNPVLTIGAQVAEAVVLHQKVGRAAARQRAVETLNLVGISSPQRRMEEYPHQLSGGMRQRVMIAMALSCEPSLLIADEPTTALDVTIQAQVLELIKKLGAEMAMSIMLITHDLGVIAEMADRVAVMYLGQVVEVGSVDKVFKDPLHPYTQGLLKSMPSMHKGTGRLYQIAGAVPDLNNIPTGCRFAPRCDRASDLCRHKAPLPRTVAGRSVRCFRPGIQGLEEAAV